MANPKFIGTERSKLIEKNICPLCRNAIGKFRDEESKKEYAISGMCQKCQDNTFG